jgi:hypothetical protein
MSIHVVNYTPMYVYARKSSWSPFSEKMEPDWSQHDCPITSVIPQQYSLATFVLLCFHFHKEKLDVCTKNVIIFFLYFLKIV